jgi:hypothetical protein
MNEQTPQQEQSEPREQRKKNNARLALIIALIPVLLFITSFFIRR